MLCARDPLSLKKCEILWFADGAGVSPQSVINVPMDLDCCLVLSHLDGACGISAEDSVEGMRVNRRSQLEMRPVQVSGRYLYSPRHVARR